MTGRSAYLVAAAMLAAAVLTACGSREESQEDESRRTVTSGAETGQEDAAPPVARGKRTPLQGVWEGRLSEAASAEILDPGVWTLEFARQTAFATDSKGHIYDLGSPARVRPDQIVLRSADLCDLKVPAAYDYVVQGGRLTITGPPGDSECQRRQALLTGVRWMRVKR